MRLVRWLNNLGLSDYEAQAYIALISLDDGTADQIAKASSVPRTSMYKVMNSLEGKDLVVSHPGKPRRYRPVDLDAVEQQLVADIKDGFDDLRGMKGSLKDLGTPQLVYTILGRERVLAKIGELIDDAVSSIFLSSPDMKVLRNEHGNRLAEAVKRGVHVVVVMEPFMKSPDCSDCHRREGLVITDLVVDNECSLLATPDFEICGFIDDPFITQHLESVLRSAIY
ncbi:MAG: helix-turn-helix domain-containing protein [Candidatus Methanomethylophilaceae archaeon]|nr:helix-turn-helix domain-containing protein [Candidatus Methanomethylophilaceae archaeon]